MLSILKKKVTGSLIGRLVMALVVIVAGVAFLGSSLTDFIKGPTPITAGMDYEAAEGSYVSFDAVYVIDEYVRQSERQSNSSTSQLKNIGYLVYFEEDGWLFGVELPKSNEEAMDAHIEETVKWLNEEIDVVTTTKTVKGTWKELTGQRLKYFKETISDDLGEEYLEIALPYYIDTNSIGDNKMMTIYMWLAIMGICLIFAIYSIVRYAAGSHAKNIRKYLASHPEVTMEQIEADFAAAACVGKKVWVGKRWTIYPSGLYAQIRENKDLVWAYYYRRTGRSSESSLRVFRKDKKMFGISMSRDKAMEILDIYEKEQKHMVLGYSKDIEQMFRKDYDSFLNMRYNHMDEYEEMEVRAQEENPWAGIVPDEKE